MATLRELLNAMASDAEQMTSAVATLSRGLTVRIRKGPERRWNIAAERTNTAPSDVEMQVLEREFGGRVLERGTDGEYRRWFEVER